MDQEVGALLDELQESGLADNTLVFYYSDHGGALPRGKRNIHDSGTRVPLIVKFPKAWSHLAPADAGQWVEQPVSFVDLPATVLHLCGIPVPDNYQGQPFLGPKASPRDYVFLFRGRMDERYDTVRAIRDKQFRYVRNYSPHLPWGQYYSYPFRVLPSMRSWFEAYQQGACNQVQARYWQPKPAEELYDVLADPFEIHNLADNPKYATVMAERRQQLEREMLQMRDTGFIPEGMFAWLPRDQTLYEYANSEAYPIQRIIPLANRATVREVANLNHFTKALADPHPVVRYWGAMGCLLLKDQASDAREPLHQAVADQAADVRIVAAESLAYLGESATSAETLAEVIKTGNSYEVLAALNSLEQLWRAGHIPLKQVQALVGNLRLKEPADRIPTYLLGL